MVERRGGRRWLIGAAVALALVVAAAVVVGFLVPPAASTAELPRSITVNGVVHERVHLITMKTTPRRDSVAVQIPMTSARILVRAKCRMAVLHTPRAKSGLGLEWKWTKTGGSSSDIPAASGENEYIACAPGWSEIQERHVDPAWLLRSGDQLLMRWYEVPTLADTPTDAPASWALAVYIPR